MNEDEGTTTTADRLNGMLFTLRQLSQADPQSPRAIELYKLFTEARFTIEAVQLEYKRLLGMDVAALQRDHVARGGRLWSDIYNGSSHSNSAAQHRQEGHERRRERELLPQLELLSDGNGQQWLGIPLAAEAAHDDEGGNDE